MGACVRTRACVRACGCVCVCMCGCVGVDVQCFFRFLSLLFSSLLLSVSPASGPAWPILHACLFLLLLCLLCLAATPALVVTTMCLPLFSFILSFLFLLKSFLLAVTTIILLFRSFFSLLPLLRAFCSHIFFSSVSSFLGYLDFIRFLVIGHVQSVRFANSNKHNQRSTCSQQEARTLWKQGRCGGKDVVEARTLWRQGCCGGKDVVEARTLWRQGCCASCTG